MAAPLAGHGRYDQLKAAGEKDLPPLPPVVSLGDLFTAKNASGAATDSPVLLMETVHLLSRIGMQTNTTYDQYVPGTPPASKFDIAKGPAEGCPQSKRCAGAAWQAHRLSEQLPAEANCCAGRRGLASRLAKPRELRPPSQAAWASASALGKLTGRRGTRDRGW